MCEEHSALLDNVLEAMVDICFVYSRMNTLDNETFTRINIYQLIWSGPERSLIWRGKRTGSAAVYSKVLSIYHSTFPQTFLLVYVSLSISYTLSIF